MRLRAKRLSMALILAVPTLSGCAVAGFSPPGAGQEKVLLCHKGKKTLEVAAPAVEAHRQHGDSLGRCR